MPHSSFKVRGKVSPRYYKQGSFRSRVYLDQRDEFDVVIERMRRTQSRDSSMSIRLRKHELKLRAYRVVFAIGQ